MTKAPGPGGPGVFCVNSFQGLVARRSGAEPARRSYLVVSCSISSWSSSGSRPGVGMLKTVITTRKTT